MHTVLLQGGCRSGKTTYVERMARPDLSWEEVSHQIGATIAPRTREALPLCWDNDDGSARQAIGSRRRRIHVLRYIDISGERDEAFLDALIRFDNELVEQKTKKNGQAQDVFGVRLSERLVVMIVWDLSVSFDENATVLNLPRVRALYQNRLGEKYISSIVFMMNKVDIAAVREGQTVRQRAGEDFRRIQEFFRAYLGEEYSPIRIIQGSLKTGEGMPDLHAALLTSLGLSSHYVHSYAGGSKNGPPGTVGVTLD